MSSTSVKTWHGDPNLKATVVARMKAHRKADSIIQGTYQIEDPTTAAGYRGCAIGCMLEYKGFGHDGRAFHNLVEQEFGVHRHLAWIIDCVFEDQVSFEAAGDFAVAVVETIPVGVYVTTQMIYCDLDSTTERHSHPGSCRPSACRDTSTCLRCLLNKPCWSQESASTLVKWLGRLEPVQKPVQAAERVLEPVA